MWVSAPSGSVLLSALFFIGGFIATVRFIATVCRYYLVCRLLLSQLLDLLLVCTNNSSSLSDKL